MAAVYPNPAGGEVTVDIKGDNVHDISVSVIDQAGRVVLTGLIARQSGSRTMIPLSPGWLSKAFIPCALLQASMAAPINCW